MNSDGHIIELTKNETPPPKYADVTKLVDQNKEIENEVKAILTSQNKTADPAKQPKLSRLARKMKHIRTQMGILPHNKKP
jgi:uncharacterized coiled-coil protein SlyX